MGIGFVLITLSGCAPVDGVEQGNEGTKQQEWALIVGSEIVINEVESSGGSPGDWVELLNVGSGSINVGG